jgi:hypothetical protein
MSIQNDTIILSSQFSAFLRADLTAEEIREANEKNDTLDRLGKYFH